MKSEEEGPRTPQHMKEILDLIEVAWRQNPDMRLGQLLVNCLRHRFGPLDLFFLEDSALYTLIARTAFTGNFKEDSDAVKVQDPP
jgi:hypothetical protein